LSSDLDRFHSLAAAIDERRPSPGQRRGSLPISARLG
jgi:hypothetical protein